jgi:glycosyltransferase-like protein
MSRRFRLRIALLTHSTNPRGGVVHALQLGEALTALGHRVVVHAPGAAGRGFFRDTASETVVVRGSAATGSLADVVETRIEDFVRHFEPAHARDFDVWHTGDGIGGNALARLKARGLIPGFARTVHHLDDFDDPRLMALQRRSVEAADELFVVSRHWQARLRTDFDRATTVVGNGVDLSRFSPQPDAADVTLAERLGPRRGPVFVSLGGIEPRKNSARALEAFRLFRAEHPGARWIIAGGASVLDHGAYRAAFDAARAASGLPEDAVTILGPLPDPEVAALYRAADALLFPSIAEGFGLAVIEAMACGTPVIASRIAPFTEYLGSSDAAWCDPADPHSIAAAMAASLAPGRRRALIVAGFAVAARHAWAAVAEAHLPAYARLSATVGSAAPAPAATRSTEFALA